MTEPERRPEDAMEAYFLEVLPQIDSVIRITGRRRGMSEDEISDFASVVKLSMVESRYRALARFEGRSSLQTYLLTVIRRMLVDFRRRQHGKWRASACARRHGSAGVELERLVFRDGLTISEAANACARRTADSRVDALIGIARSLPVRQRVRTIPITDATTSELRCSSPTPELALSLGETSTRVELAVCRAVAELQARDRRLIRLRLEIGLTAKEIGRVLGVTSKSVYRRCDAVLSRLRKRLLEGGISWKDVARTAQGGFWTLRWPEDSAFPARTGPQGVVGSGKRKIPNPGACAIERADETARALVA